MCKNGKVYNVNVTPIVKVFDPPSLFQYIAIDFTQELIQNPKVVSFLVAHEVLAQMPRIMCGHNAILPKSKGYGDTT